MSTKDGRESGWYAPYVKIGENMGWGIISQKFYENGPRRHSDSDIGFSSE